MNKKEIVQAILDELVAEFERRRDVSKRTRTDGNDEESKSEGKYDTRSIEENYLADGLAKQAQLAAEAAEQIESLDLRDFAPDEAIDLGALVGVRFARETEIFFVAPSGGGTEVECGGVRVTVLTPESPLGSQLLGRKAGARTKDPAAEILSVA